MTSTDATRPPSAPLPLSYAEPALRPGVGVRMHGLFHRLGGPRQFAFAAGLATVLGAAGYALGHMSRTNSETAVLFTLGGGW